MLTLSQVHVLGGDLTLHRRTLAPIKSLIYGLRRYDADRTQVLVESVDPHACVDTIRGYMSHQAKVYLASSTLPFQPIQNRRVDGLRDRRTCMTIWNMYSPLWTCSQARPRTSYHLHLM